MNLAAENPLNRLLSTLERATHPWWIDDGYEQVSPAVFVSRVRQRAVDLQAGGAAIGVRKPVTADDTCDFFVEMCAIWLSGAVFCPIEPGLSEAAMKDVETILRGAGSPAAGNRPAESTVLLTSGSTGSRKGVRLTLQSLLDNARASVQRLGMTHQDHLMINIPFHFTSAVCHFLACLQSGARLTAIGKPLLAKDLVDRVRSTAPTGFGGAPLQARWLADGLAGESALGWLMTSGDDLPISSREAIYRNLSGIRLHVFYGLTEVAGRLTSLHPDDRPLQPGSVGQAIEGLSVEVLDDAGEVVEAGQLGEVHAKGHMLMLGYIGQEGAGRDDGRFPTGDIGWKDAAGYLYLAGRRDDVFKVSGTKVSGLAVREALLQTGLVAEAFVIPVRMRTGLIVAGAMVVPHVGTPIDLPALRAAARATIDAHALPREFITVDNIPRTGSGKPDRRAIDNLLLSRGWCREHGVGVYSSNR